jgi:hypothetical protein
MRSKVSVAAIRMHLADVWMWGVQSDMAPLLSLHPLTAGPSQRLNVAEIPRQTHSWDTGNSPTSLPKLPFDPNIVCTYE